MVNPVIRRRLSAALLAVEVCLVGPDILPLVAREWTGLDIPESQRAVEDRQVDGEAAGCEIIGGAPTTLRSKGHR